MNVGLKLYRLCIQTKFESYSEVQVPVPVPVGEIPKLPVSLALTCTYDACSGFKGPVPVTRSLGAGAIFKLPVPVSLLISGTLGSGACF